MDELSHQYHHRAGMNQDQAIGNVREQIKGKPRHSPLRSGAARNNRNRIVLMGTIKRKSESC